MVQLNCKGCGEYGPNWHSGKYATAYELRGLGGWGAGVGNSTLELFHLLRKGRWGKYESNGSIFAW